jgi:hypothetical protein
MSCVRYREALAPACLVPLTVDDWSERQVSQADGTLRESLPPLGIYAALAEGQVSLANPCSHFFSPRATAGSAGWKRSALPYAMKGCSTALHFC